MGMCYHEDQNVSQQTTDKLEKFTLTHLDSGTKKNEVLPVHWCWGQVDSREDHHLIRAAVLEREENTCQKCNMRFSDSAVLEKAHIIERRHGGCDCLENLKLLCIGCHSRYDGWEVGDFDSNRINRIEGYIDHHNIESTTWHIDIASHLLNKKGEELRRCFEEDMSGEYHEITLSQCESIDMVGGDVYTKLRRSGKQCGPQPSQSTS